jgi:type II secretory pathway component PulM
VKGRQFHGHGWILTIGVLVLIAAHVTVLGLVPRDRLLLALAGIATLFAIKYAWWWYRR